MIKELSGSAFRNEASEVLGTEEVPAVLESEFSEKIRDVVLRRAFCNVQLARNLLVWEMRSSATSMYSPRT